MTSHLKMQADSVAANFRYLLDRGHWWIQIGGEQIDGLFMQRQTRFHAPKLML